MGALRSDQVITLFDVPWKLYVQLLDWRGENSNPRLTYLRGTLELMSPSSTHELFKTCIARLLEAYAVERDVDLIGYGSTTYKKKREEAGLEADECYFLNRPGEFPDISIEVALRSGFLPKLEVYAAWEAKEVWFWKDDHFEIYGRTRRGYRRRTRSLVLPDLDIKHLTSFVTADPLLQTRTVRAYVRTLRQRRHRS